MINEIVIILTISLTLPFTIYCGETSSDNDKDFLLTLEKKAFDYFIDNVNRENGLVKDNSNNFKKTGFSYAPASVAATGFGLSAYCVGVERGWISKKEAEKFVFTTLDYFYNKIKNIEGFFYHFVNMKTGKREWNCEISSIDSSLFLAGAFLCSEYFNNPEITELTNKIYKRINWLWMTNKRDYLCMGWKPKQKFLPYYWDHYSENTIMYLMAIASPTHPLPVKVWHKIKRDWSNYDKYECIFYPPLFTHQYSMIWLDLRDVHDDYANYFYNSTQATLANRQFCIDNSGDFQTYGSNVWGLTACDGPDGYKAYGGPPGNVLHDGTVAPTAAIGSIVFTPDLSIRAAKTMYRRFKNKLWGLYGFSDSFNLDRNWYCQNVIAIDQGTILLMIENYLSGFVWKTFMKNKYIKEAMTKTGFRKGSLKLNKEKLKYARTKAFKKGHRPSLRCSFIENKDSLNEYWDNAIELLLTAKKDVQKGSIGKSENYEGRIKTLWDNDNLYLKFDIDDAEIINDFTDADIWRDDAIEVFIDPQNDGLIWGKSSEFQIGLSPDKSLKKVRVWTWFQNGKLNDKIKTNIIGKKNGYIITAEIPWNILNIKPEPGKIIGFSPAFHNVDKKNEADFKLNWFFFEPGIILGKLVLYNENAANNITVLKNIPGLIADFNSEKNIGNIGGNFGIWQLDPSDKNQYCKSSFSKDTIDKKGFSYKLSYDVESNKPACNGFWLKLQDFNASGYKSLSLWIKGDKDKGFPKKLKIELKTADASSQVFIKGLTDYWKEYDIGLTSFKSLNDMSSLTEFVIVFDDMTSRPKTGQIYIDNIKFKK